VKIARVVGNVLATVKHEALFAQRLLLVEAELPDGKLDGRPRLALDVADAGEGDRVLVVDEGNSAAQVPGAGGVGADRDRGCGRRGRIVPSARDKRPEGLSNRRRRP
jgi:ethanolamine utilization protein EutN